MSRTLCFSNLSVHQDHLAGCANTDPRVSESVGVEWGWGMFVSHQFPGDVAVAGLGSLRTAVWDIMYQNARPHSCCLWACPLFLPFLESTQCMCCSLIPSIHSSIYVFNNNPKKQKSISLWKMWSPSNKRLMPQHLNCAPIFPFIKNSIELSDVSAAAWRGGRCSDIQKTNEHANSEFSNVLRINGGFLWGNVFYPKCRWYVKCEWILRLLLKIPFHELQHRLEI